MTTNEHLTSDDLYNLARAYIALALWEEWFKDGDPWVASEAGGDVHCFFCYAWRPHEEHTDDCIYVRAKMLFKDAAARVNDERG